MRQFVLCLMLAFSLTVFAQDASLPTVEYKLLATSKTSTMQKEMNETAALGFRFAGVMGGETSFGGPETVVIMAKGAKKEEEPYRYKLLATSKTSTMQKEIQEAGDLGYTYKGQTVFETAFGGKEVVVILEREPNADRGVWDYKLLATKKTGTMQKELSEAGGQGYEFVGLTVGETAFAGNEVVCILRRPKK